MGFLDPTDFRWILPTETDANSPLSEELMSQIRENTESNTMNRIYSGYRAQVVTRDSDTQITIEKVDNNDADWATNIAASLVLVFQDGVGLGQDFAVTANTELLDTPDTATVTISGVYPVGLLPGDILLIMYAQTGLAHTHDGIDSAPVGGDKLILSNATGTGPSSSGPNTDHKINTFTILLDNTVKGIYASFAVTSTAGAFAREYFDWWLEFPNATGYGYGIADGTIVQYNQSAFNTGGSQTKVHYTSASGLSNLTGVGPYRFILPVLDITSLSLPTLGHFYKVDLWYRFGNSGSFTYNVTDLSIFTTSSLL